MMVLAAISSQRSIPPQFAFNQAAGKGFLQNPDAARVEDEFDVHTLAASLSTSAFPFQHARILAFQRFEAAGSGDFSPLWWGRNPTGCRDIPAA
jgi:hypothetical protein